MFFVYEFFLYIVVTLVGSWLWDLWTKKAAAKENRMRKIKNCLQKTEHCFHELDYNSTHGVGGPRCPFITEAQKKLLHSEEVSLLGDEVMESLKSLIINAGKANEYTLFPLFQFK